MRSLTLLCLAAVAALVGCNNNPVTTYRVEIDGSALANLPPTCYQNNAVPATKDINPNERSEFVWTMWSEGGSYYLNTGTFNNIPLGQAASVVVTGSIQSPDGKAFDGKDTRQNINFPPNPPSNYSNSQDLEMNIAFQTAGGSPTGTINLSSQYSCTNCLVGTNDGQVSCGPISLAFSGVSISTTALTPYPANAQ